MPNSWADDRMVPITSRARRSGPDLEADLAGHALAQEHHAVAGDASSCVWGTSDAAQALARQLLSEEGTLARQH